MAVKAVVMKKNYSYVHSIMQMKMNYEWLKREMWRNVGKVEHVFEREPRWICIRLTIHTVTDNCLFPTFQTYSINKSCVYRVLEYNTTSV